MKLSELLKIAPELDHEVDLKDGDFVSDLMVVSRVINMDEEPGTDALIISKSDHTTGIVQYGIIASAQLQVEHWMTGGMDDD